MKLKSQGPSEHDTHFMANNTPETNECSLYDDELAYVTILNKLLPPQIRILTWSPTSPSFDARFDCLFRRYVYIFPREGLDMQKMNEAAQYYVGSKDYRFFCYVDPAKGVKSYERTVLEARVVPLSYINFGEQHTDKSSCGVLGTGENLSEYVKNDEFIAFEVKGQAFLWHQVRCMVVCVAISF